MPAMDQNITLSYCPNSPPSEVVFLSEKYCGVAKFLMPVYAQDSVTLQAPSPVTDVGRTVMDPRDLPTREASTDFIPAPNHSAEEAQRSADASRFPNIFGTPDLLSFAHQLVNQTAYANAYVPGSVPWAQASPNPPSLAPPAACSLLPPASLATWTTP